MLRSLFLYGQGVDVKELMMGLAATVFVVFCSLPVHEFAHAWTATKLGDDTPGLKGRLTLNPMAHLSLMGSLMIFLVGFGYAKPVPVNIRNFKNRKRDFALVAAAGPASNLIMAFVFLILSDVAFVFAYHYFIAVPTMKVAADFFFFAANINIYLAVFNLLPIPPLDGSRIATLILPDKYYYRLMQYERYIMIVTMLLLFTGVLSRPLSSLAGLVLRGLGTVADIPFKVFGL